MSRPFLTARWEDLVLASFHAPAELLEPHLPPGTELDTPDEEPGAHLVSVVALRFRALRVHGVRISTAQDFPEVNLRFYAREGEARGAVFLRELVPNPLVAGGALLFYREPYRLARLSHEVTRTGGTLHAETRVRLGARSAEMNVVVAAEPRIAAAGSVEHWLKEHYWGFGRGPGGRTIRYRVAHPVWRTYPVLHARLGIDPGLIMGGEWAELDWDGRRHSVVLAEGSVAAVYRAQPLEAAA